MLKLRDVSRGLTPRRKLVYADIAWEILAQRFLLDNFLFALPERKSSQTGTMDELR